MGKTILSHESKTFSSVRRQTSSKCMFAVVVRIVVGAQLQHDPI